MSQTLLALSRKAKASRPSWVDYFITHGGQIPRTTNLVDDEEEDERCFQLSLHTVESIHVNAEKSKEYAIRLSLFDVTFKRFFGRTWVGPKKTAKSKEGKKMLLQYNIPVYFHSSITDPNVVIVAEIVSIVDDKNGRGSQVSCGWSVLRIFQQGEFVDTSSGSSAQMKHVDVYHGSPRALLYMDDDIEGHELVTLVADCQLCYSIKSHRLMNKIVHLLPENTFFSRGDIVPGVAIADDGDNFRKPKPLKATVHGVLDKITVNLPPSIEKFEEDLCDLVNKDRMAKDNVQTAGGSVTVAERRLHVCLHNGWDYIDKPQIVMLDADNLTRGGSRGSFSRGKRKMSSSASRESLLSTLQVKSKIQLKSLIEDPLCAVVFLLEYIISLQVSGQDTKLTGSIRRSETQSFFIRWVAWSPDFSQPLREVTLTMDGGTRHNPDQVLMYTMTDTPEQGKRGGGTISFSFKIKRADHSRTTSTVSGSIISRTMEPKNTQAFPSMMSLPTSEPSAHLEMNPALTGKPPLPSSPRRITSAMSNQSTYGMDSARSGAGTEMAVTPGPIQITHLEGEHQESSEGHYQDQLQEMPFAPVHAPIIPTLVPKESGPKLSRAAYAFLYQAGFPQVRDRHGDPPDVVDILTHAAFRPQKEITDMLQCNEIVIQFLALTKPSTNNQSSATAGADFPKTVFFTFQFYRYPAVTTERLLVAEPDNKYAKTSENFPLVLKKFKDDQVTARDENPGWMITYRVDPEFLKPGEGHLFIRHLYLQTLRVDVWDGDSLLLIGSSAVQLKHLLRGGREAVQISSELDIVTSEYNETTGTMTGDLSRSGSIRPVGVTNLLKGHLHVRLTNIGHTVDKAVSKPATLPFQSPRVVIQDNGTGAFRGGRMNSSGRHSGATLAHLTQSRTFMASHMAEVNQEVATALSRTVPTAGRDSNPKDSKQQRKLNRMKAVREALGQAKTDQFMVKKEEKIQRTRNLKTIEIQRAHNKKEGILLMLQSIITTTEHVIHLTFAAAEYFDSSDIFLLGRAHSKKEGILLMLQSVITTEHVIHPTFAAAEYFEFELRNPYNEEHTITIQWEDPELGVVTNSKELRFLKKMFRVTTTDIEEDMFSRQSGDGEPSPGVQVFLKPKEKILIPFKYQSFEANHQVQQQGPTLHHQNNWTKQMTVAKDDSLEAKTIKVFFRTPDNKPISVLELTVEPQPHIVDQTFRFQHPEQSFLKKSIRLPMFSALTESMDNYGNHSQVYVRCSDENVICESKKRPAGEPQDVFIKVACAASPSIKKFYIVIYLDPHLVKPIQIWQFYVHALHRMDVSCVEGQAQSFSLVMKGTAASRLVKCFSSHPQEMVITPGDPFMLMANSVHEVQVHVSPREKGNKYMYINLVDVDYHQLVRTWLIAVTCKEPVITKGFELLLPVGGGKGSNKKISYKNPYPTPRVFFIKCNRPDLVQFKENTLRLEGGETTTIGMRFTPCQYMGSTDIYIFINDETDKNEETFLVRATYKP